MVTCGLSSHLATISWTWFVFEVKSMTIQFTRRLLSPSSSLLESMTLCVKEVEERRKVEREVKEKGEGRERKGENGNGEAHKEVKKPQKSGVYRLYCKAQSLKEGIRYLSWARSKIPPKKEKE